MKAAILKILEMQEEGKITKEQAAELLAVLADQAREKNGAAKGVDTQSAPSEGAPGPRGDWTGSTGARWREAALTPLRPCTTWWMPPSAWGRRWGVRPRCWGASW